MDRQFPKVLAIIPCYNEAGSIGNLLQEFSALDFPIDTLVVDDGSQDQTYSIASQFSQVLRLERNQGVPAAIKAGIGYALENGYSFCIQIDGDGQHIPSEISKLIDRLGGEASPNILIGSRYYRCATSFEGGVRRIAGWFISFQLQLVFGRWVFDPLSGMRMLDRMAMRYFFEHIDAHFLDAQIVPYALRNKFTILEVPVKMRPRMTGTSYVSGLKGVKFLLRLMWRITQIKGEDKKNGAAISGNRLPALCTVEKAGRENYSNTV